MTAGEKSCPITYPRDGSPSSLCRRIKDPLLSVCVCVSLQITGDYNPSSFLSISAALLITTRRAPLSVGPDVRRHRLDYLFSW